MQLCHQRQHEVTLTSATLSRLPASSKLPFRLVETICLHYSPSTSTLAHQLVLFSPATPSPGLVSALSPKEESRPTKRKVHRLFNGVMATSLLRPNRILTAASRMVG